LSRRFATDHRENCHHWDYTFLLWHRKFVNKFWSKEAGIGMERFYFLPFKKTHIKLFKKLTKTLVSDRFYDDWKKMARFTDADSKAIVRELQQAFFCDTFDIDLDRIGSNRSANGLYNISFSSQLEEAHDMIHGHTGAGMGNVATAGGDACFFIHHTFMDLCFEFWLHRKARALPFSKEHFAASPYLQKDFKDYAELEKLWSDRYYAEADYAHFEEIYQAGRATSTLIKFDDIKHSTDIRQIVMQDKSGNEIGRFAIFTGSETNCIECATKKHTSSFSLTALVQLSAIVWFIFDSTSGKWNRYDDLGKATKALAKIGLSTPYIISFG